MYCPYQFVPVNTNFVCILSSYSNKKNDISVNFGDASPSQSFILSNSSTEITKSFANLGSYVISVQGSYLNQQTSFLMNGNKTKSSLKYIYF